MCRVIKMNILSLSSTFQSTSTKRDYMFPSLFSKKEQEWVCTWDYNYVEAYSRNYLKFEVFE